MTRAARWVAIAIAVAGLLDPALSVNVPRPIALDTRLPRASSPTHEDARQARARLAAVVEGKAVLDGADAAQAIVVIGDADLPATAALPVVSIQPPASDVVRITSVSTLPAGLPGQVVPVTMQLDGEAAAGRLTTVSMAIEGVRVSETTHRWAEGQTSHNAQLVFVPSRAGVHRVRVTAETEGLSSSVADLGVVVRDRPLRVLVYEPRPSWPVTFVRRALEEDPIFRVSSLSRSSRGITTTVGQAPASLQALHAGRYDAVIVGAPDELTEQEQRVLDRFASLRAGHVVLLPDRRMPARTVEAFGLPPFDEVLLERAVAARVEDVELRASELLAASTSAKGFQTIGTFSQGGAERAVILASVRGEGRVVVSGLLDAWRYRAQDGGALDRFWRSFIADAALSAPAPLDVQVEPALARPGDPLTITAKWRRTELTTESDATVAPPVEAALVGSDGSRKMVRLWPEARPGTYRGTAVAPSAGQYVVTASGASHTADAVLRVEADVLHAAARASQAAQVAARITGGVTVNDPADVLPFLERLNASSVAEPRHVMRSPWWILPFGGLLTIEWWSRRRRGLL